MRAPILSLFLIFGCSALKPGEPPDISYGRQECARCGMIVSEERYAAGYIADDGSSHAFDDLGELLAEVKERPDLGARSWARDFEGKGWLMLSQAHVVQAEGLATPMGTGWVAFSSKEAAQEFLRRRKS